MSTIQDTSDLILTRLKEIDGPRVVDDWGGEIDELIKQAAKLPGLFLVYTGAKFDSPKLIGTNIADYDSEWTVVVIAKNLRGKDAAAAGCYELIDGVRDKMIGYVASESRLWPVSEGLIFSGGGKMAYALSYSNTDRT